MNQCIITGCSLVDIVQSKCVWGDLWEIGTAYVFNACLTPTLVQEEKDRKMENRPGEARWQESLPPDLIKQLIITQSIYPYFERRGIIALPKEWCRLNKAAKDYLS